MSAEVQRPWAPTELPPRKGKTALEEARDLFEKLYAENFDKFRAMATSTCNGDSVLGSLALDKAEVALRIWRAAEPGSMVAAEKPNRVHSRGHWIAQPFGVDRNSMLTAKAEYQAIETSDSMDEVPPSSPDTRRDAPEPESDN